MIQLFELTFFPVILDNPGKQLYVFDIDSKED